MKYQVVRSWKNNEKVMEVFDTEEEAQEDAEELTAGIPKDLLGTPPTFFVRAVGIKKAE